MKLEKKKKLVPKIELVTSSFRKAKCGPACKPIEDTVCEPEKPKPIPKPSFMSNRGECGPSCSPSEDCSPESGPCKPGCSPNDNF
jgi:hypothetical protein